MTATPSARGMSRPSFEKNARNGKAQLATTRSMVTTIPTVHQIHALPLRVLGP